MRKRMEREGFLGVLEPEDLLSTPAQKATCAAAGLALALISPLASGFLPQRVRSSGGLPGTVWRTRETQGS